MSTNNKENAQKLLDAMEFISDEAIENADKKAKKKASPFSKIGAAAACLALVGGGAFMLSQHENLTTSGGSGNTGAVVSPNGYSLTEVKYPKMASIDSEVGSREKAQAEAEYKTVDITGFYEKTVPVFLSGNENKLFSPSALYLALGMCAESSKGDTRDEILALAGCNSIEDMRNSANILWKSTYSDDGTTTSHMSSSVWLNSDIAYKDDTLLSLADNYYTSTYYGDPADENYSAALRGWMSQQTHGFLDSQISEIEIPLDSVMGIVSTVYFKSRWDSEYNPELNTTAPFFTENGEVECEYMNGSDLQYYCYGDKFSAIESSLGIENNMVFILPDEGYTTDDLLADKEVLDFITTPDSYGWENHEYLIVNRTIPKFDISYNTDLIDGLKALGVESMFDFSKADFTPLTDTPDIAITTAKHGVRVKIDEEGVEAGAYVEMFLCGAGAPPDKEINFVLDRPFIFVIKSHTGCPMFVGVVANPNE